ncbi:MAG: acylneuraminate cytidylyltransferase family protein [Acidobacteriota bacterium]|nr:acylneuraminate cytidylyltransferase family protein [Acidobacteriota bacterium]
MSTLAVIPARGGSKGVPRKNVRPLAGVPLIAHTIRHAREASEIDRVIVSTDDDEIAAVATGAGAEVVRRPAAIAGDKAPSEAALLHVLETVRVGGYVPDEVVFLQCTSPLRRQGDLDGALRHFRADGCDSLFTAVCTNPFRWRRTAGGLERINFAVGDRPMRQDREPEFVETGSFYITKRILLESTGVRLGGRVGCWEMPPLYAFEIDSPEDLDLCAALMEYASRHPERI